jgi:hypothetical protein
MTEDNKPSRFHASPAQIDAFLREHFAEDALLNFYRAVGDEVLDEIQTSGQTFRRLQEQAQAKHVFLSGVADVLAYIQDDRYFPAQLPKLASYDRPFNPPRTLQEWGLIRAQQVQQVLRGEHVHAFRTVGSRPSGPDSTASLARCLCGAVQETDSDDTGEPEDGDPAFVPCTKCDDPPEDHIGWNRRHLYTTNPQNPAPTADVPQPCYRTKTHDAHKWLKGRKAVQCPGTPKETP